MLDSLATKAQLNHVAQYEGMVDAADTDEEMDVLPRASELEMSEADGDNDGNNNDGDVN